MYKKSAVLICILFLILSGCAFTLTLSRMGQQPSCDAFGSGIEHEGTFYYIDGGREEFRFFSLEEDGKVNHVYVSSEMRGVDLANDGDDIYVLMENELRMDPEGTHRSYRIRQFTDELLPTGTSAAFELHAGAQAKSLSVENGNLYISAISEDGKTAEVYEVNLEERMTAGDEQQEEKKETEANGEFYEEPDPLLADSIMFKNSVKGRFFVDAAYHEGIFYTRNDSDMPNGYFVHSAKMKSAIQDIHLSFGQNLRLSTTLAIYWVAGTALILVFLILCFMAFANRRRLVYTGLLVEVIFAAMLFVFFVAYAQQTKELQQRAREDYADNGLSYLSQELGEIDRWASGSESDKWYDSTAYRGAQGRLSSFVKQDGNRDVFYDVLLIRTADSEIVLSASGKSAERASELYGTSDIWKDLREGSAGRKYELGIVGHGFSAKGLLQNGSRSRYALVAIINETFSGSGRTDTMQLLRNLLLIFVVGSALLFLVIWLQARDLRRFEAALREVALRGTLNYDKSKKKKTHVAGHDLDSMWNSLGEIDKRIEQIDYHRFRVYEAYYRFAPRNIEKILHRASIFEVKSGDASVLAGTLAFAAGTRGEDAEQRVGQLDQLLNFMAENKDKEGIIVGQSEGQAVTELLFLDDAYNTQEFAVDFLARVQDLRKKIGDMCMLLYFGSFTYGIAGNSEQSLPFLLAPETRELSLLAEWFREQRLYAVITKEVHEREGGDYDLRYIGYTVINSTGRELHFYEMLDACPKRERQARLADRERFNEALNLLYRRDFYIARNAFSDILKRNPGDEIARWYVFECERLLDSAPGPEEKVGALRPEVK
ncbi:MAG: hypothetical protein IK115_03700 [Lachnospiraceae bacterium]|nr:hypothetical protein [Lachnospiraceae bacterium]